MRKSFMLTLACVLIIALASCAPVEEETSSAAVDENFPIPAGSPPVVPLSDLTFDTNNFYSIVTITAYTGSATEITIPAKTAEGEVISWIGDDVFADKGLTKVVLLASITSIGEGAFENNPELSSLTLSNNLEDIGDSAFSNDPTKARGKLESVTLPNSLKIIGNGSFAGNTLTSLIIPDGVETINQEAFKDNKLTTLTIGSGITNIRPNTFTDNNLLSSVTVKATTPPTLSQRTTSGVTTRAFDPDRANLYVPTGAAAAYNAVTTNTTTLPHTSAWTDFFINITEK